MAAQVTRMSPWKVAALVTWQTGWRGLDPGSARMSLIYGSRKPRSDVRCVTIVM